MFYALKEMMNYNSLSLLKILSGASRTIKIIKEMQPIYDTISPIAKKIPDLLDKISSINTPNSKDNNDMLKKNNPNFGPVFFR